MDDILPNGESEPAAQADPPLALPPPAAQVIDPALAASPADPATNPYPPGHPNLAPPYGGAPGSADGSVPHAQASAVFGSPAVKPVMGLYDSASSPLFPPAVAGPGAVSGMVPAARHAISAAFERVRTGAQEFANVVRGFEHPVDPDTDLGKLVAAMRHVLGISQRYTKTED